MITVQVAVPLQAPDHPAKKAPFAGTAVSFTLVPELKEALQVGEQLMPAGELVTVPFAVPASRTVNLNVVAGADESGVSWAAKRGAETRAVIKMTTSIGWQAKDRPPAVAETESWMDCEVGWL
jgi:hypothetical protein